MNKLLSCMALCMLMFLAGCSSPSSAGADAHALLESRLARVGSGVVELDAFIATGDRRFLEHILARSTDRGQRKNVHVADAFQRAANYMHQQNAPQARFDALCETSRFFVFSSSDWSYIFAQSQGNVCLGAGAAASLPEGVEG